MQGAVQFHLALGVLRSSIVSICCCHVFFAFFIRLYTRIFEVSFVDHFVLRSTLKWYSTAHKFFRKYQLSLLCLRRQTSIRREKLLHDRQFFRHTSKHAFILLAEFFYAELCMIYIYIQLHHIDTLCYFFVLAFPFSYHTV